MQERTMNDLKKIPCQHGYCHAHAAPRDVTATLGLNHTYCAS